MTQEDFAKHQAKQADIKQFIQILTPFSGINPNTDLEVQSLAVQKLKELIPQINTGIKESVIRKI